MGCGDAVGEGRCVCREAEWMNLMKSARKGLILQITVRICKRTPGIGFSSLSLVKPDVRNGETGKNRSRSKRRLEDGDPLTIYFVLDPQGCRLAHAKLCTAVFVVAGLLGAGT